MALLLPRWSELSIESRIPVEPIDFRRASALERIRVVDATPVVVADGLDLVAPGPQPRILLERADLAAVAIEVELRTALGGGLEVAWRPGMSWVASWRRARLPLRAGSGFSVYRFELGESRDRAPLGYELELRFAPEYAPEQRFGEPGRAPFATLRSLRFETAAAEGAGKTSPLVGRARIGRETREVLAIPAPGAATFDLPAGARAVELSVARRPGGRERAGLRVALDPGDAELLEVELGPESLAGWRPHRVRLPPSKAARKLMLSFAGRNETGSSDATPSWAGAVLVANPVAVVGSPDPRPDVILVSLDTVGAQSFLDARRRGLLPHFDRLARRGLDLRRARTNSTTTSTAHSVLLTGRLPARAGNLLPSSGNLAPSSLAERLLAAGYSTTAITGGGLVTERLGHHRGFETFSREDSVFSEALWSQHDIEAIAAKVESWLESDPGGRFLFVHTYEAHGPYLAWPPHETSTPWSAFQLRNVAGLLPLPPERLHELLRVGARGSRDLHGSAPADAESALGAARATQQQEMARIDRHLGPLLDRALARESPARTIVLVTADHGEAFFEHGLVEHTLLEESNLQVPLLAVGAGFPSGVASDAVVHTVDIAPTILELLGLDSRTDLDGSSFASGSPRAPRRSERTYAFTGSQGFAWEVADEKWVTFTGLANENFGYAAIAKLGTDAAPRPAGSGDSEPPSPEAGRFALATFDGMPGLHLDLSTLAGRELDVRFGDSRLWNNALHAWDAEPLGEFRSASRARRLRLGEEARIWLLTDRLVAGAELVLADLETGAICRLDRASGWSSARRGPARGCEGGLFSRIRIWREFAATAFDEGGPLGSDELQKILALGYLR